MNLWRRRIGLENVKKTTFMNGERKYSMYPPDKPKQTGCGTSRHSEQTRSSLRGGSIKNTEDLTNHTHICGPFQEPTYGSNSIS